MNCPHCGFDTDIKSGLKKVCPNCGKEISYGGNTTFFSGVQRGKLTLKDIFSDTFKRHQKGDALRSLLRTPNNSYDMISTWKKPWMFVRLFAFLLVFAIVLFASRVFYSTMFLSTFIGCMVIPLTMMLFIWEMDIHGTVSIFDTAILLFIGGVFSMLIGAELNAQMDHLIEASWTAALTEEPAKLLIGVIFILLTQKKRKYHALDGLAIAAAIAAGFSFMETVDYVFNYDAGGYAVMINRSIRSLGGHITYAAPALGALCYAMNGENLRPKHFIHPTFLIMLGIGMGCHAMNNSGITIMYLIETEWLGLDLVKFAIIIVSWTALIYMFRLGINQALQVADVRAVVAERSAKAMLRGVSGQYMGANLPIMPGKPLVLGRMMDCSLIYSPNVTGVSRKHCSLEVSNSGQLIVRDLGSSNGTYINGNRAMPNQPIELRSGDVIAIGSDKERFEVA